MISFALFPRYSPVFYSPDYEGYCIRENEFNNEREQIYRANTLIIHCVRKNGEKASYLASLIDPRLRCSSTHATRIMSPCWKK